MPTLGYTLASEEHGPRALVAYAQEAERIGFSHALISDHYHPWIDRQGQSPFVWSVIGAVAQATERLTLGTGVTCPTRRIHPAIIAQAAATAASLMPDRFFLGLGTGENLNEHILGQRWPAYDLRADMLEEAVAIIRALWQGDSYTHYGRFFTVENARIYTLPDTLPPLMMAASGTDSAEMAGRLGDGLISTAPDKEVVDTFQAHGNGARPRFGQMTVCCGRDAAAARRTARDHWPTSALHGQLNQELPTPAHFEQATRDVTPEMIAEVIVCGNDVEQHRRQIDAFAEAGFDHVYIHQVGPDQDAFFEFYAQEILPAYQ